MFDKNSMWLNLILHDKRVFFTCNHMRNWVNINGMYVFFGGCNSCALRCDSLYAFEQFLHGNSSIKVAFEQFLHVYSEWLFNAFTCSNMQIFNTTFNTFSCSRL
eukprot:TRINITY_DN3550_c1_g1_i5.p1 TRINITY_DN3550_c1_g1~~TRINITY_DN3550_c1_g1_i5.p1  ORF type:complete len:104 (+),score=4.47 TRINITY_DN3550_c1_g1_i5:1003-1314(+)